MMDDMMSGMFGTMGLITASVLIILLLGAAALIKYLFKGD